MSHRIGSGLWASGSPLVLLVAPLPASAIPPPVEQFAADCASPTYASDQLVCGDPQLLALDRQVVAALARAGAEAIEPSSPLIEAQAAWLKRRSLCAMQAGHRACLMAAYGERIVVLTSLEDQTTQSANRFRCSGRLLADSISLVALSGGHFAVTQESRIVAVAITSAKTDKWVPFIGTIKSGRNFIFKSEAGITAKCKPSI